MTGSKVNMNTAIRRAAFTVLVLGSVFAGGAASAEIFVKAEEVARVAGDPDRNGGWFTAESFSFGVSRNPAQTAVKGGTTDINIGVGELQDLVLVKSLGQASPALAQFAVTGASVGACEVCLSSGTPDKGGVLSCQVRYLMDRCFITGVQVVNEGGQARETVSVGYQKIAFGTSETQPDGSVRWRTMSWDRTTASPWQEGARRLSSP